MRCADLREDGDVGGCWTSGFGNAEVDDFRNGAAVLHADQDVGRLQIAVDHTFLVRVLHGVTDIDEQLDALARVQTMAVAVLRDRHAMDQFHDEVRPAAFSRAGVEHPGDTRMVHHRQRLPLGLEPGDELAGVHPELEHFQRNAAGDGRGLLCGVNRAHPALAEDLQDVVRTDALGVT